MIQEPALKIAFVVHDYNQIFGHSRYVSELATRFAKDHEVHVFANQIDEGLPSGIVFHRVPAWRKNAFSTVLSFLVTGTLAVGKNFDIIHGQGMCGWKNDVITVHQVNREWFLSRMRVERSVSWRERVFGMVIPFLEKQFYRQAGKAQVIAISRRVEADLRKHYDCHSPTTVIHHGADLETFSPLQRSGFRPEIRKELGLSDDEVLFLFVGDMRKGARQCIQALKEVPGGKLVFVSRSKIDEWAEVAKERKVENRVIFAGPSSAVQRYYAAADVFLLPTPYDPFALVATEAMAAGLAVVVSGEAGASELIEDGKNGFVLKDVAGYHELAEYMKLLYADPSLRLRMGQAARSTMEDRSWDHVAAETMDIYRKRIHEN